MENPESEKSLGTLETRELQESMELTDETPGAPGSPGNPETPEVVSYESLTDKRGRKMVYEVREGVKRLVAREAIPEGAVVRDMDIVGPSEEIEDIPEEFDENDHNCMLRDGKPGVMRRLVNGHVRYLCEDDYYHVSLGDLVAYLRESGRS